MIWKKIFVICVCLLFGNTVFAADTGFLVDGSAGASGWSSWTGGSQLNFSDDVRATCDIGTPDGCEGQVYDFGVLIPDGETVTGVEIAIEVRSTNSVPEDSDLSIILCGNAISFTNCSYPSGYYPEVSITGTDTLLFYGGATEDWGITLSESVVEATNFGFYVVGNDAGTSGSLQVDRINLKVYYGDEEPPPDDGPLPQCSDNDCMDALFQITLGIFGVERWYTLVGIALASVIVSLIVKRFSYGLWA